MATPLVIDSHAHFEPRMLTGDDVVRKMDGAGVDRVVLIPTMLDPVGHTPELLLAGLRRLMRSAPGRVVAEATHRALLTAEGDLRLKGERYLIYARPDNASVVEVARRFPDKFLGWIFLNPRNNPHVLDDLEQWRQEPSMIGIKLHPHWHDYRTEILGPVLGRAQELGLPVLIHLGFRKRGDYRAICEHYPRLKVIFAHAGMPFFGRLWKDARRLPNMMVDLSSPYLDERIVRDVVAAMGPERCLYGTDSPYGFEDAAGTYDYSAIKRWIERLPCSAGHIEEILGGNFLRLVSAS